MENTCAQEIVTIWIGHSSEMFTCHSKSGNSGVSVFEIGKTIENPSEF